MPKKYIKVSGIVEKECKTCNKKFEVDRAKQGSMARVFCSDCNPHRIRKKEERVCDICNNKFKTCRITGATQRRRCSAKCQRQHNLNRGTSEETKKKNREHHWKKNGYAMPKEDELVFYNYKAPLTPLSKGEGYGYDGVLLYSKDALKVQCHVCGMLFRNVATHANFSHGLTAVQYKKKFHLNQGTALVGEKTRDLLIKAHDGLEHGAFSHVGKTKAQVRAHMKKMSDKSSKKGSGGWTLEKRNEMGLCPAQLLKKIHVLGDKLGRRPFAKEYMREYGSHMSIITVFGKWNDAIRLSKYITTWNDEKAMGKEPEYLLESLRLFYQIHKRTPQTSDAKRGLIPPIQTYCEIFGTLNNARIRAGVPVLLRLSKYRYKEVTLPENARKMYIKKMAKIEHKEMVKFSAKL